MRWTGEAEAGFPYWWEGLAPEPLETHLPGACDLLVIGAGYTGLSAALAAQKSGARVVVVDAGQPGQGASTRNGGMFGAHPRLSWEALARRYGEQVADGVFAEAVPAQRFVEELIRTEGIACDLQRTGRIQLAWSEPHFAAQRHLARRLQAKSAAPVRIVEREALSGEVTSPCYFGGLIFEAHCGLHPAKFHRGLLRAVLRRGVPVVAEAGVQVLDRDGAGFVARTARGTIRADKVVLATNGYTSAAFRRYMARVFPLPSFIIATEPLPAGLARQLAPGGRMMVETRARHSYFRLSPDGTRVLFGGRASMVQLDLQKAARRLRATMCEIWPELRDVALSHVWTGNTGYSFGHMPHVGDDRGLHHAMGFSGSGTVMAPYLGAKAAFRATGDPRGATAYTGTELRRHVLHPFRQPHFLHAADAWYRGWVDRREARAGRRIR